MKNSLTLKNEIMIHNQATSELNLNYISALHESGGGYLTRLFDGHPELGVYPFELQLGTPSSMDGLRGYCFQSRFRWPKFPRRSSSYRELFDLIEDRELKNYLKNRSESKFSEFKIECSEEAWLEAFSKECEGALKRNQLGRAKLIEAYISSFFSSWTNRRPKYPLKKVMAHCPMVLIDAVEVLQEFPRARIAQVVRHPVSTFQDSHIRIKDLNAALFSEAWNISTTLAAVLAGKFEDRFLVIRFEDLIERRAEVMNQLCNFFDIAYDDVVLTPTWNCQNLEKISPFGGVREISEAHEQISKDGVLKVDRELIERLTYAGRQRFEYE
jgi:hypothetical protein